MRSALILLYSDNLFLFYILSILKCHSPAAPSEPLVLTLLQTMLEQCPSGAPFGCSCDLIQVQGPDPPPTAPSAPPPAVAAEGGGGGGPLTAVIVEVYCDNRGLTEFPPKLPDNTTTLYIRNNRWEPC